jgi:ATP-dependent Clp protease protease subunit
MSLSDKDMSLLKKNVIDIVGNIDFKTAAHVRECLSILVGRGSPDITLVITSSGGDVDIGLNIYDMLRLYPGKKTGKVIGFAKSMAVIILQVCDIRKCAMHASILIHHISRSNVSLNVLTNPDRLQKTRDELTKKQGYCNNILSEKTKQSVKKLKQACEEEKDMTAEEAKEFGLVDEII